MSPQPYRKFREVQAIRLALNLPIGEFCAYAGIHPTTYWEWKSTGRLKEQAYQNILGLKLTVKRREGPPPPSEKPPGTRKFAAETEAAILNSDLGDFFP